MPRLLLPSSFHAASQFLPAAEMAQASFEDSTSIHEVVAFVMKNFFSKALSKKKHVGLEEKLSRNYQTMGDLRRISDAEWRDMHVSKTFPAVFLVYLQYFARLSQRRTPLSVLLEQERRAAQEMKHARPDDGTMKLANDFNGGNPIDMSKYSENMMELVGMGFTEVQALDALLVTGNNNMQVAVHLLLGNEAEYKKARAKQVIKMKKLHSLHNNSNSSPSPPTPTNGFSSEERNKMMNELKSMEKKIKQLNKQLSESKESSESDQRKQTKVSQYGGYLLGLKTFYEAKNDVWHHYTQTKKQWKISKSEHQHALQTTNIANFNEMKKDLSGNDGGSALFLSDCVICLEHVADHVVMDCMHVCICTSCASTVKGKKCPICSKHARRISKVYMS